MFYVDVWSCTYVYICTSVWLYFNSVSLAVHYVAGFLRGIFSRFLWIELHLWIFSRKIFTYKCRNEYKCKGPFAKSFPWIMISLGIYETPPQNNPLYSCAYFHMTIILYSIKFNTTVFGKRIIAAQDTWHIWWYRDYAYWNNAICYVKVNYIHSYVYIIYVYAYGWVM